MADKAALRRAILTHLEAELAVLAAAAQSSRDEATNEENRQEGKYDMRAQSAAYLAAGQSKLATELAEAIAAYRSLSVTPLPPGSAVTVGALLVVESAGRRNRFLLGPARGGLEVPFESDTVTVVTPASPLGRQLLGRTAGEVVAPGRRLVALE